MDSDEVLWNPHWTCCRKGWEEEGCSRTYHKGPFIEDYMKEPRKYEWPDWRVQIYFKKTVSPLWQKKMEEQYTYDNETLLKKLKKIAKDDGTGGVIIYFVNILIQRLRVDSLAEICDKLGLHLLMNSEEMSHHFRFVDVINSTANNYLDDGAGFVDFDK